jgi:hypothetical protein
LAIKVSADSVQKSPLESSNSTISTDLSAQKPLIARAPFNGRNIPVEAPLVRPLLTLTQEEFSVLKPLA